jgi:hypothetical protein
VTLAEAVASVKTGLSPDEKLRQDVKISLDESNPF